MVLVWMVMVGTGLIIINRISELRRPDWDLPALFQHDLGPTGKWLCTAGYIVIFYGIMVAYLSAGSSILSYLLPGLLPGQIWLLIFFATATSLTLFGVDFLRLCNTLFLALAGLAFVYLLLVCGDKVAVKSLGYMDWEFLVSTIPIITCGFAYHLVLPSVCQQLEFSTAEAKRALLIGMMIPLAASIVWILVVIGTVPLSGPGEANILTALHKGLPATQPLSAAVGSTTVKVAGVFFSLFAILTSYLGVSLGLRSFVRDVTSPFIDRDNTAAHLFLVFGPPLVVALLYPHLFLKALDLVGGVGIVLVFGILPVLMELRAWKTRPLPKRIIALIFLVFLIGAMTIELGQEFGLLKIEPHIEYWKSSSANLHP
jgi:tyrosine-specific transport protein